MKFTIRRAQADDVEGIVACLRSLGYEPSAQLVADKLFMLAGSSADAVWVAVEPSAGVVGVVSLHILPLFHAPGNLARLTALAVLEGHRGKGVGRALVTAAEAFAWEHDSRRIEVTSGDQRPDAHLFYEHLGYRVDERRFLKHRSAAV